MIITKTPFRISFFGGGTDYPAWYREHGGSVLATTINKYCYITCRELPPFFEYKHRIVYSKIETVRGVEDIVHPAARAVIRWSGCKQGLEMHHDGDLPARSGLGSSSSFTVGLIHAVTALEGRSISREELARSAIYIEQDLVGENVGSQDQVLAAFGGFNRVTFSADDDFDVSPVVIERARLEELQSHLMLFFTGLSRFATIIAKEVIDNFKVRRSELMSLGSMVRQAQEILDNRNAPIDEFGRLLHDSWLCKRSLAKSVSTPEIDCAYDAALAAGAIGGKILGAGGGGFLLLFAAPERQAGIRAALRSMTYVPFRFEKSGSRVVLYEQNGSVLPNHPVHAASAMEYPAS